MKDKKLIDEKNLDELLNKLFLDKNSEETDEASAQFIFQQEYPVKIDAGKEKELMDKLKSKLQGPGTYFNLLIIIFVVAMAGTGFLFYKKNNTAISTDSPREINKTTKHRVDNNLTYERKSSQGPSLPFSEMKDSTTLHISTNSKEKANRKQSPKFTASDISVYYPHSGVGSKTSATFFKPTEQDFMFYNRVKKKMLEKLVNVNKEMYTSIAKKELQYRDHPLTVNSFVIRNQYVTNLEYKVFLAELLKAGRTEEFKQAIIKNEAWINYNDNILATTYFFDEKYNDFPVVNMSPRAASLFCEWFEKEINLYAHYPDEQAVPMRIRLPFDTELILAAKEGYSQIPDCEGYNTIYDIREGVVDKNYIKHIDLIKLRRQSKKTELDELFSTNRYGMNEDQILRLLEKGFAYQAKHAADSTYPGNITVFSNVAHVSEIILEQKTGNTKIAGSCWKSKQEYLNMVKEFNTATTSPFVGFRVVVIEDKKENL